MAEIESRGGRAVAVAGDVSDYEQAQAIVRQTIDKLGGLHIARQQRWHRAETR